MKTSVGVGLQCPGSVRYMYEVVMAVREVD